MGLHVLLLRGGLGAECRGPVDVEALVHQSFGERDGDRGRGGEARCERVDLVDEVLGRDDPVDQAERRSIARRQVVAEEEQFLGLLDADGPGQQPRAGAVAVFRSVDAFTSETADKAWIERAVYDLIK